MLNHMTMLTGEVGVLGVCQLVYHGFMFTSILQLKISDKTKFAIETKMERGIFCCLHYSKIIAKGEVAGM